MSLTKVQNKKILYLQITAVFLAWIISLFISRNVFFRPLSGTSHEWLTGHTLVSIRAFEEWGFFRLFGVSGLMPRTYEFLNIDITRLTKTEGIYLSYPSFWLILPYMVFKALKSAQLIHQLTPQFIFIYNLVMDRLFCGLAVFGIYLQISKRLLAGRLKNTAIYLAAYLGLLGWMFNPSVLYWTQNIYFADQAVLLPLYVIFFLLLRVDFDADRLTGKHYPSIFFILSFLACGIDYYGAAGVIFFWFITRKSKISRSLFLGAVTAGLIYLAQLIYFKDGFHQIAEVGFHRTLDMHDEVNHSLTNDYILMYVVEYWTLTLPRIYFSIFSFLGGVHVDSVVLLCVLGVLFGSLTFIHKGDTRQNFFKWVYLFLFAVPVAQIFILKQHSLIHNFSSFKLMLGVTFLSLVWPVSALFLLITKLCRSVKETHRDQICNAIFYVLSAILAGIIISSSMPQFDIESGRLNPDKIEYGRLLEKNFSDNDLLMEDCPICGSRVSYFFPWNLRVRPYPQPDVMWYSHKAVYYYKELAYLTAKGILNVDHLSKMQPVFLSYKDETEDTAADLFCSDQWVELKEKILGRTVVVCRSPELKKLYMKS